MFYKVCPFCNAHLDPCERRDCRDAGEEAAPQPRDRPQTKLTNTNVADQTEKVKISIGGMS